MVTVGEACDFASGEAFSVIVDDILYWYVLVCGVRWGVFWGVWCICCWCVCQINLQQNGQCPFRICECLKDVLQCAHVWESSRVLYRVGHAVLNSFTTWQSSFSRIDSLYIVGGSSGFAPW